MNQISAGEDKFTREESILRDDINLESSMIQKACASIKPHLNHTVVPREPGQPRAEIVERRYAEILHMLDELERFKSRMDEHEKRMTEHDRNADRQHDSARFVALTASGLSVLCTMLCGAGFYLLSEQHPIPAYTLLFLAFLTGLFGAVLPLGIRRRDR